MISATCDYMLSVHACVYVFWHELCIVCMEHVQKACEKHARKYHRFANQKFTQTIFVIIFQSRKCIFSIRVFHTSSELRESGMLLFYSACLLACLLVRSCKLLMFLVGSHVLLTCQVVCAFGQHLQGLLGTTQSHQRQPDKKHTPHRHTDTKTHTQTQTQTHTHTRQAYKANKHTK